jgi:hypothetical protein
VETEGEEKMDTSGEGEGEESGAAKEAKEVEKVPYSLY